MKTDELTIEKLKDSGLIAYEYIRGSTLYGLNNQDSDIDIGGVYIAPIESVIGLPTFYKSQVSDERNDTTYYEVGTWLGLLLNSNPNAIESLFVPNDKVIGSIDDRIKIIIENREAFLTKKLVNSLYGYAYNQIKKARGLNKKIVNPVVNRKTPLDFCYVTYRQGTISIEKWLEINNMKQEDCGITNLSNMRDVYALYHSTSNDICYRGIIFEDSNDIHLSKIPIDEKPINTLYYNKDGYIMHCREYKEYQDWVAKRNPVRYESNLNKNYDSKNMMHCIRLMHMGIEVLEGKSFNVVRTDDKEFLMDVRNHKFEYDNLIEYVDKIKDKFDNLIKDSEIPEFIDIDFINDLLVKIRRASF